LKGSGMKKIIVMMAGMVFFSAQAQADESWYLSAGVGVGFLSDAELDDPTGVLTALATELLYDPGFGFSAAYGYRWNKFRLEGEITYDVNDLDKLELLGIGVNGGGDTDAISFMLNGWRDFPLADPWSVNAGAGLGFAVISLNDITVLGVPLADDSDAVFAYQFGVGLGYALTRDATLTLDYRLFATLDPDYVDPDGIPFSSEYFRHTVRVGVRWDF